ncbi:hypothetical protein MGYG_05319 [Nannizzia gypsea CBS 118893]|uniref:CENP-V/GFA domain-containing protein n=1 Tax=Arthroderma gypseum (strain ATCC MYA-4604 / CBS 118893) TaxID=535722 RepID=E4UVJ5_ARTGP|nr:hypothetical protein MGYG_05319 [Nannizzia gypsea CBS 118893]EFR02322.1 hypothetical protein MGYG_05319 [Nannizzia gypsea CBS 118893]
MVDLTRRGICMCQGVVYEVEGKPEKTMACYCKHCKLNAGGAFQIVASFNKEQVKVVSGENLIGTWTLKDTTTGNDKHKRFCTRCGCTLWTVPMMFGGDKFMVRTSLLENGLEDYKPEGEIFTAGRPAYIEAIRGI